MIYPSYRATPIAAYAIRSDDLVVSERTAAPAVADLQMPQHVYRLLRPAARAKPH
jgi:hypothetical protein